MTRPRCPGCNRPLTRHAGRWHCLNIACPNPYREVEELRPLVDRWAGERAA